jgi:hypothetical protein
VESGDESHERKSNWAGHLRAAQVLEAVLARFEERGIAAIPVKGVVTARTLYEDIALRHPGDIDLRIRRSDFRRAITTARALGWTPRKGTPVLWQTVLTVMGCEVDIECTLGPPGLCAVSIDDLLSRARTDRALFGFPVSSIELHDHALVLAVNVYKDWLHCLPWSLADLRRVVRAPGFEPSTLVQRAREGRISSVLWLVADWLVREHGMTDWRVVRDHIGAGAPSRRVAHIYGWLRRLGSPPKLGLVAAASSSDAPGRAAIGVSLALAGAFHGKAERALGAIAEWVARGAGPK